MKVNHRLQREMILAVRCQRKLGNIRVRATKEAGGWRWWLVCGRCEIQGDRLFPSRQEAVGRGFEAALAMKEAVDDVH